MCLFPYGHSVLFTELAHSELVQGGGHVLGRLLQVLGVTLHQGPRDAAAAVLLGEAKAERSSLKGSGGGIRCLASKHRLHYCVSNERRGKPARLPALLRNESAVFCGGSGRRKGKKQSERNLRRTPWSVFSSASPLHGHLEPWQLSSAAWFYLAEVHGGASGGRGGGV